VSYDFIYNRSGTAVEQDLTLTGTGRPYLLDTWTGRIEPMGRYTTDRRGVRVNVRIAPNDKVIIALAGRSTEPVPAPVVHAVSSTGEVLASGGQGLTLRRPRRPLHHNAQ